MHSFARGLEITCFAIASFLPWIPAMLYCFRSDYRFSIRTSRIFVAIAVFLQINILHFQAAGLRTFVTNPLTTLVLIALCFTLIKPKGNVGRIMMTIFIVQNTSILVYVLSKYAESFFAHANSLQPYRWTNLLFLLIIEIPSVTIFRYFIVNVYGPALKQRTDTPVWKYLWAVPATFYLIWHVYLFGMQELPSVALLQRTAVVIMLFLISAGSWIMYYIIILLLNAEAQHERYERIQSELQDALNQDALTHAASRKYGEELIKKSMARGDHSYVAMVDLDHFKSINDLYGHDFGDQALQAFAATLKQSLRSTDTVVRWGGDEFVCVFEGVTDTNVDLVCEKMRRAIHAISIPHDREMIHVTSSVGVTKIHATDLTIDSVIKRADGALYEAKQGGRDRYVIRM